MNANASQMADADVPAPGTRLPHLAGRAAEARQVLAAHYLKECAHIVEIGGAGLPITHFLTHQPQSVMVIDPKIVAFEADTLNGSLCRVRHVAAKFQAVALDVEPGTYGLALIGLSLKPFGRRPALDESLLRLVREARIVVIDYAVQLERAHGQWPALLAASEHDTIVDLAMRLDDPHFSASGYAERRLIVLAARGEKAA
jgi:hypothetical protein